MSDDSLLETHEQRLSRLLLSGGMIREDQLRALEAEQKSSQTPLLLAQLLLSHGYLTAWELAQLLRAASEPSAAADQTLHTVMTRRATQPPERLGNYRVLSKIAQGGMATVYHAIETKLDRPMALKILWEEPGQEQLLSRLHREAKLAAALCHPHIIAVHEVGTFSEPAQAPLHYIAMAYIDGGSLADGLDQMERSERLRVLLQVAEGVAHAHSQGVIHRDLKPANILLTESSQAIVTDFGLARQQRETSDLTLTGAVLGTPHYMAPEQVQGHSKDCDARTDVWALGVMLYHLLTDELPFGGDTLWEVQSSILELEPEALSDPVAWAICLKALSKAPDQRYPDANAFLADLRNWQAGRPVSASAPRKRRWPVAVLAAAALTAVCLVAFRERIAPTSRRRPAPGGSVVRPLLPPPTDERQLRQLLAAVRRQISELRASFYIADQDVPARQRELIGSLEQLEQLTGKHPNQTALWTGLGEGWYWLGQDQRAEQALERAEALAPEDGWVHLYLGRIYLNQAMWLRMRDVRRVSHKQAAKLKRQATRKALLHMTRKIRGWAGEQQIDRALARAYRLMSQSNTQELDRLCREALERFKGQLGVEEFWLLQGLYGRPAKRVAALTRAIAHRPHYALAYFWRGYSRQEQGDHAGAIADCSAALALRPGFMMARFTQAASRYTSGDMAGAAADFTRVLELDPRSLLALINLGRAHQGLGQLKRALTDYNRFIAIERKDDSVYCNRSMVHQGLGQLAPALADAERAIQLDPKAARNWAQRGAVRSSRGDKQGAVADYDKALKLDPQLQLALHRRGLLRSELKDISGALADFSRAILLEPKFVPSRYQRGYLHFKQRNYSRAIADLQRVLELAPRNSAAHFYLGRSLVGKADYPAAIRSLTTALRLDRKLNDVYHRRALARLQTGDAPGALADMRRFTQVEPGNWRGWLIYGVLLRRQGSRKAAISALRKARRLATPRDKRVVDKELARSGG